MKNGVDYLGFHFYLSETGKVVRKLKPQAKKRYKNRLKKLKKDYGGRKELFRKYQAYAYKLLRAAVSWAYMGFKKKYNENYKKCELGTFM